MSSGANQGKEEMKRVEGCLQRWGMEEGGLGMKVGMRMTTHRVSTLLHRKKHVEIDSSVAERTFASFMSSLKPTLLKLPLPYST